jgi:hypothetical protein
MRRLGSGQIARHANSLYTGGLFPRCTWQSINEFPAAATRPVPLATAHQLHALFDTLRKDNFLLILPAGLVLLVRRAMVIIAIISRSATQ